MRGYGYGESVDLENEPDNNVSWEVVQRDLDSDVWLDESGPESLDCLDVIDCAVYGKDQILVLEGNMVWVDYNNPGVVYISDRENWDWYVHMNGSIPNEITETLAVELLSRGDSFGRWELKVLEPLSQQFRGEMERI